jgi:DNA-binding LacI/PurR family transcriptional regulator
VRVPVVVDSDEPELADFDQVLSDHEDGSYQLTKWLIERGRRRILRFWQRAPLPVRRPRWLAQRDKGYERAVREAGLEVLPPVEFRGARYDESKAEEFEQMARQVAGNLVDVFQGRNAPDAVMAISDGVVFPLAAGLRLLKRRPNEDVWLAGYDRYWADCLSRRWEKAVPLATVDKRNYETGRALVRLLVDRIAGRLGATPQRRVVTPELVIERSGD